MKKASVLSVLLVAALSFSIGLSAQSSSGFNVVKTFPVPGPGGWDYIAVGPSNNRLYVSHSSQVNILDEQTGDSVGVIPNTTGVHGIAFCVAAGRGFTSNGRLNTVSVFDLASNAILAQIRTGQNPDAIMYEPFSKMIITCNGGSKDLSLIDPVSNLVVGTIPVGGKPETAVSDEAGKIYVNIEDKNEIAVVDMHTKKVENHWSLAPAEGPTGLAIDLIAKRLFAGCDKLLVVVDAANGKIVDKLPIADGCDGVAFDAELHLVFASCGEGILSVIRENSVTDFKVIDSIPTKRSARTIAVDERTHQVFLPAADFEKNTPAGQRPKIIPGTFGIIVLSK